MAKTTGPSYTDIAEKLRRGTFAPLYFLCGEEPYFVDVLTDYIEQHSLADHEKSFNLTVLYGKDVRMADVLTHARRFPMMASRQTVVVKEAQEMSDLKNAASLKILESYALNPVPSTVLVFAHKYKSPDGRSFPVKAVENNGVYFQSKKIYDNQLPAWITEYLREKKMRISAKACMLLSEYIGNDLLRIANEINKITVNLKEGEEITEEFVIKYVGISKEYNVFELQKALTERNALKVAKIIKYFAADPRNNPLAIVISTLYRFFIQIISVHHAKDRSEQSLAKLLGLHPFFVKDFLQAAKAYSPDQAFRAVHLIRQADLRSKGIDAPAMEEHEILRELVFLIMAR